MKKFQVWAYGLLGGCIGGGATSASAWLGMAGAKAIGIDVPSLNFKAVGVIFVSGAMVNAFSYLKQSPLPPLNGVDAPELPKPITPKPAGQSDIPNNPS